MTMYEKITTNKLYVKCEEVITKLEIMMIGLIFALIYTMIYVGVMGLSLFSFTCFIGLIGLIAFNAWMMEQAENKKDGVARKIIENDVIE